MEHEQEAMADIIGQELDGYFEQVRVFGGRPPGVAVSGEIGQAEMSIELGQDAGFVISVSWESIGGEGAWTELYVGGPRSIARAVRDQLLRHVK